MADQFPTPEIKQISHNSSCMRPSTPMHKDEWVMHKISAFPFQSCTQTVTQKRTVGPVLGIGVLTLVTRYALGQR